MTASRVIWHQLIVRGVMNTIKINRKLAKKFLRQQLFDTYRVDNVIYYDSKLDKKIKEAAYDHILLVVEAN